LKRIRKAGSDTEVDQRELIYDVHQPIERVYFPETGVVSIVTVLEDGRQNEVATVGYEGMVGLPVFFGANKSATKAFWQISGRALALDASFLENEKNNGSALSDLLHLYTQGFFTQLAQSVTCNRLHTVEQRCARWLLMTRDRVTDDRFPLTQEFLAQMLGAGRQAVNEAAQSLQEDGLIRYSRGDITVLDRAGLERRSCECYSLIRGEFERLLPSAR
jgi:CRP-like cAMP-binding protein